MEICRIEEESERCNPQAQLQLPMGKSQYMVIQDLLKARRIVVSPGVHKPVYIGINAKNEAFVISEEDAGTDALFGINLLLEGGGTWLIPSTLPCIMDGKELSGPSMLTNGATIIIKNRYFRYIVTDPRKETSAQKRRQLPSTPGLFTKALPPQKPVRSSSTSSQPEDTSATKPVAEGSTALIPSYGDELLNHLNSPKEVVGAACEFISRQVMCKTDLMLSSDDLDSLFRFIHDVSENNGVKIFFDFVRDYNNQQKKLENAEAANHAPVIWLMTELLKVSLDPEEHHVMWLRLLNTFSHFVQNIPTFVEYQTIVVILGSMTAHPSCSKIHQFACCIMAQLAQYIPKPGQMVQLKCSGIELVLRTMALYPNDPVIVRPACRTLSYAVTTLQTLLSDASTKESVTDVFKLYESTFEFMREKCPKPVKKIGKRHPNDRILQIDIKRILNALSARTS
ncbi:uncharacterized protein LOC141903607 isoform X1 [Tubulanus polymorphus]|uniref:uncharacterized protein LOC141903607 isoform X1 n=1 Tax=Tubulanus polymorphus TaxID=672921 RepID=UPI003DA685D8